MPRPLSISLSSLVIFGMIQLDCNLRAQSPKEITNSIGMKLVLVTSASALPSVHLESPSRRRQGRGADEGLDWPFFYLPPSQLLGLADCGALSKKKRL